MRVSAALPLALLLMMMMAPAARADVSTPPAASAANPDGDRRNCSLREWLAIKHAAIAWCSRRPPADESGCAFVRGDVTLTFCDGEGHGQEDRDECRSRLYVRENPERCQILGTEPDGALRVRVQPDCWTWELVVTRRGRGFRVRSLGSGGNCD